MRKGPEIKVEELLSLSEGIPILFDTMGCCTIMLLR